MNVGRGTDAVIGLAAHVLQEGLLQFSLEHDNVEVAAPSDWLALMVEADARGLSLAELDELARARWGASEFMAFVQELLSSRLAALHPSHAARPVIEFFEDSVGSARAIARARLRWPDGSESEGWGRAAGRGVAAGRALGEAVERHAFVTPGAWRLARGKDVQDREADRAFVAHTEAQYRNPGFPLRAFSLGDARPWIATKCLHSGATRWIPAEAVHPARALGGMPATHRCAAATSSGFACAPSLAEAIAHALHELVERDAFMRHWLAQRGGIELLPGSLPPQVQTVARELEAGGCRVHLQCLTLGVAPVWLAMVQHEGLGFTCTGAAAGPDDHDALDRALAEAHALAMARMATAQGGSPPSVDPEAAVSSEDHAMLYADSRHFRRADALMACTERSTFARAGAGLEHREAMLHDIDASIINFSASSRAHAPDGSPLHTVRVISPVLMPMTFGALLLPLAFGAARSGAEFPHPFA